MCDRNLPMVSNTVKEGVQVDGVGVLFSVLHGKPELLGAEWKRILSGIRKVGILG